MPRAHDPRGVPADRQPSKGMGGPIPDFGQYTDFTDTLGLFIEGLLKQIKDWTGIDLFWMLDWSWTTNTILELIRQANDLTAWLQNPIQRPPNLLSRPSFSSPSAIAAAPDWSWDPVISLGTVTGPGGVPRTDPQGSARTTADGSMHSMVSNAISEPSALTPGQILTCQIYALVEDGFTASDDQAIRLELVPSRLGVLQEPLVLASCGVPTGDPGDWIAAPVDAKAVFFDVDYTVPETDSPDTVELRLVVSESAGGDVPVRFDGARVAAAGGFLVVLADLFEAGRVYLTALWDATTAWLEDVFDADHWSALKTDTDAAWDVFVRQVKRALHHADADLFHPPSTSDILSHALRANPWFGWIFEMVDDWLRPVLWASKAATDFSDAVWHAVTVFVSNPLASGAWASLTGAIGTAWNTLVDAVLAAWGSPKTHTDFPNPGTAATSVLRNNDWFGWLFDMVDDWLQPVLTVGKALVDFGDTVWHAITAFVAAPGSGAWTTMVNAINSAWNVMVDAVLTAWGSPKDHTDFASPAASTVAALKNNPVTGWLFGSAGLASTLTAFSNALWDYLLGGSRYDGTNRTAWSTAAGAKLETAWRNLWGQITGNSPASAPAPGSAQSLWNGISSTFIQSTLAGIWEPLGNLGSLLTKAKNLINALWDYAFGGSLYNGSAVTALSSTAGQNVSAAFNALATQFGSTATAKTKGQIGSAVATSVLAGLFPTTSKFESSFAWLGDMFQNGAMPSTPPADPVGTALNQAWEWLSNLMGWQTTTEVTQKNAQNFQISALTGGYRNPIWACRYPVGDVSYPESLNVALVVYNAAGSSPRPNSGNPAYVVGESPWVAQAALYNVLQNESRGAFVMISNTAVMDKLGMFGYAAAGLNNLLLELFRIEPGVGATRIFWTDATNKISANTGYFEVDIPGGGILAQAGESYLVRLRNNSSVAGAVQVRAIGGLAGSPSVGIYTTNSTDTNKTTYTTSDIQSFGTVITPFALFASQGQVATDQLYADDFNRSGMGALWYLQSTNSDQIGITLGTTTYTGSTDGHQHAVYTRPLASDRMWVEGNFYNINSSTPCGLLLNCNRDLSQVVYLYINNAVARIYTGSAGSLTQRATVNTTFNSVPWQFYYDPATNKYTVLKNGKTTASGWPGLSWTDSGNVISHGALNRYGGMRISHASLFHGGNIDNWVLKDWS